MGAVANGVKSMGYIEMAIALSDIQHIASTYIKKTKANC